MTARVIRTSFQRTPAWPISPHERIATPIGRTAHAAFRRDFWLEKSR
jgi:hypothetical protein